MLAAGFYYHCHEFVVYELLRSVQNEQGAFLFNKNHICVRSASHEQLVKPAYLYGVQQGIPLGIRPNALQTQTGLTEQCRYG